ncbi:hypothetical protein ACVIQY_004667 [Bradyrhizobium sp. USDA 3051]
MRKISFGQRFEIEINDLSANHGCPMSRCCDAVAELDDIIHQPLRLKIMAALNALPATGGLEFSRLKKLTGATDGNLGAHIETLAKAG